jgi:nitrogen fixation NifU-like protein
VIGDGIAFAGVAKYPARVKCALLGWMAFKAALAQASASDTALASFEEEETADERNRSA